LRLDPNNLQVLGICAWIWATCPDARYRDGQRAVEASSRACALTDCKQPKYLAALAASYAEQGDFESAIKSQNEAIELLPKAAPEAEAAKEALKLYQDAKPLRPAIAVSAQAANVHDAPALEPAGDLDEPDPGEIAREPASPLHPASKTDRSLERASWAKGSADDKQAEKPAEDEKWWAEKKAWYEQKGSTMRK
jgi:tetratricopeptide (TPR) repeat protein